MNNIKSKKSKQENNIKPCWMKISSLAQSFTILWWKLTYQCLDNNMKNRPSKFLLKARKKEKLEEELKNGGLKILSTDSLWKIQSQIFNFKHRQPLISHSPWYKRRVPISNRWKRLKEVNKKETEFMFHNQ